MNVLLIGSRIVVSALAQEITDTYLGSQFDASQEHSVRRLNRVKAIERRYMPSAPKCSLYLLQQIPDPSNRETRAS